MDKLTKTLVFVAAGCLMIASCGAITPIPATPTPIVGGGNATVITPEMKGQTLHLKVGDTFVIQIPTIPTAGFNWQAQDLDTTILAQLGDPLYKTDTGANSTGGIVAIKFMVVGPGTTPLNLVYAAPPQNGQPSMYKNTFGLTIVAK